MGILRIKRVRVAHTGIKASKKQKIKMATEIVGSVG
jgi:hypothetical protein